MVPRMVRPVSSMMQAVRGGRVKLAHITAPEANYNHSEKGDALHAMELALSLEKLNFQKLRDLHGVAEKHGDAQMQNFIEVMLQEQVRLLTCLITILDSDMFSPKSR